MTRLMVLLGVLSASLLLTTACGETSPAPVAADEPDVVYDDSGVTASCEDFTYWQDAQDALDGDSDLEAALDDDYDGVACNDLGQSEFEEAWPTGYVEACEEVFVESPDGVLYLDGTGYEETECEDSDPGPVEWEADSTGEPETDGKRAAWTTACDEFFNSTVGGDLYWGDDVEVTQSDCEYASPY